MPLVPAAWDDKMTLFLAALPPRQVPEWLAKKAKNRAGHWGGILAGLLAAGVGAGILAINLSSGTADFTGVLFVVGGLSLASVPWFRRKQTMALLRDGVLTEACIESLCETKARGENYQPVYEATLSIDTAGATAPVIICSHEPEVIRFIEERCGSRQPVQVLYDVRNPKHVLLPETL